MLDVVVDDRVRLVGDLPRGVRYDLRELFEHSNPAFHQAKRMGRATDEPSKIETWRDEPDGSLSLPRGGARRVVEALKAAGVPHRWVDRRERGAPLHVQLEKARPLWPFQREMMAVALREETALLQAGTGSGKTECSIGFIAEVGVPTLIVVHNGGLMDQWIKRAVRELGIPPGDIGTIGGGRKARLRPVTVALHQTLARPGGITEAMRRYFGAVVVDEVHRYAARTAYAAVDPFPARYRVGLTADHKRKDGKHPIVRDLFGEVAYTKPREELVAEGHILDVEVRVVPTAFRADWFAPGLAEAEARVREGRGWPGMVEKLYDRLAVEMASDVARNELALSLVRAELALGERAIVLARRHVQLQALDRQLTMERVATGYLVGGKGNAAQFQRTVAGLADGTVRVGVGTIEALGTGIDLPDVAVAVVVSPIAANKQLTNQVRGRVCRTAPGKPAARMYYLWDEAVHPKHLENLVQWNPTVRVLRGGAWVDGRAQVAGATLDGRGITDRQPPSPEPEQPRSPTRMRSRIKPQAAADTTPAPPPAAADDKQPDQFNKPEPPAGDLARDSSALYIALKAKGFRGGRSDLDAWEGNQRLSAAMWAQGKVDECPAHVAGQGDTRVSPPPSTRAPDAGEGIGTLAGNLCERKGLKVTIPMVARWTPEQRREAAAWVAGGARPAFLAEGSAEEDRARDGDPAVHDEHGDPRPASEHMASRGYALDGDALRVRRELRVVWGEEKYTLVPNTFCMCTVGPFEEVGTILPGETSDDAHARIYGALEQRAHRERDRKLAAHRAKMVEAGVVKAGA
jgi:superfamily II DNA or RNA helicase